MEDEREQTPKEKIIWGHRYTCDACDAEGEIHETAEAAQAEQDKHRDRKHGGLRPRAGDSIEKVELRREAIAESESSSGSGGGWILLLIIIVIAYAASK
ncbi:MULTISPECIES: hypothetical protein [Streptomyces]|uniref:hypothetical protein n=1 Tax=Streptomyces TaxID=1883 RepID=UPI00168A4BC9|nr:hypothetical protein [Streptomyces sp. JV180]MBD3549914.1 hypothetical protein [Streptomyces sp. JV180]